MSLNNLKIGIRLGIGFGAILLFIGILSWMSLTGMDRLAGLTEKLYKHPFTVSTTMLKIERNIVDIRNEMRSIALNLENPTEVELHVRKIDELDTAVKQDFAIIHERFLGDKSDVVKLEETFGQWKPLREQALNLIKEGKHDEIRKRIEHGGNAEFVAKLREQAKIVTDFALNKAKDFYTNAEVEKNRTLIVMYWLVGAVLLVGVLFAYFTTRSITAPMKHTVEILSKLAQGDLTVKTDSAHVGRKDEIGVLLQAMKEMTEKLVQVMVEVRTKADGLSNASEELSATAQSMSQGATEQAASVEETTASLEQMTSSIGQNTENSKNTNAIARDSARQAQDGGQAVAETVAAMRQIAKKINIIEEIAYKTNILALNAAIEAARAGEHGRGFAVVAAEVQKLAENSQNAAQEISQLANSSVSVAETAGTLLERIVPSIQKTADLVQEITAASQEQNSGVTQINNAMAQLDQISQQNASSAEELAATAEEVSGQAGHLQQVIDFFKLPNIGSFSSAGGQTAKNSHAVHSAPQVQHTASKFADYSPPKKPRTKTPADHKPEDFVKFDK